MTSRPLVAPPDLGAVSFSFVPSPDGSMPTGVVVSISGSGLGRTPGADSLTVASGSGQALASAVLGGAAHGGELRRWSEQEIVLSVPYESGSEAEAFS